LDFQLKPGYANKLTPFAFVGILKRINHHNSKLLIIIGYLIFTSTEFKKIWYKADGYKIDCHAADF